MTEASDNDNPNAKKGKLAGLVVIGSSAGGIEALLTFVASLPDDFPGAVVVAQHLDPHRPSRLDELIANRTSLRVCTASGYEKLEPGTIYAVPIDRDVEVSDHHIELKPGASLSRPSINRLMATAAEAFGEDLVGVVLSGTGSDGAEGAGSIKEHGGTVIVQNPRTAEYPGMPESVPPSATDVVAELEDIGPLVTRLLQGTFALPSPGANGELRAFLEHVREQSGLDFGAYKRPTIERRLQRRMVASDTPTLAEYRKYLGEHPEEMPRLVASFLIKVTRFFRDPELYGYLREKILPALIDDATERGELRIWSAGCATGEEAYTIAMLVTDLLDERQRTMSVRVFATDVSTDAVEFARHGMYPDSALDDMPGELVERHFLRHDGAFEVRKTVRSLVVFGEHDLSRRAPFPRIDLVLCRNVLIYFTSELQRRSLQLFAFSLRQNGYLVLGKAESVSPLPEYFALEQSRLKIFRRIGSPAPIPVDRIIDSATLRGREYLPQGQSPSRRSTVQSAQSSQRQSEAVQSTPLLDLLSVGVVMVDRNYDIQTINVAARRLLGIVGAGLGEDLVHRALPVLAGPIRAAIDAAFRGEHTMSVHRVPEDVVDEDGRDLSFDCGPARAENAEEPFDTVMLQVVEVTSVVKDQRVLQKERDEAREENTRLKDRAARAIAEVRELRVSDQAMAAEHGRLRSENEQFQLSSEEAQAAAEEIETLSEEQQATNEELETLNEELTATVEELNTTNADLQARAVELEEFATRLAKERAESDDERARLGAILANMGDAVLVVDKHGDLVLINAAWRRMLGPIEEFAPEDGAGKRLPQEAWPQQRAVSGESFMLEFTLPGEDGGRRWFEAHSQPVHREGDIGDWGVVVVRDITERSLRHMQERFLAVASHELRTPLTSISGSLQLISRRIPEGKDGERLARYAGRAQEQMTRLELLVRELTDVARLRGGSYQLELEQVDLAQMVRRTVELAPQAVDGQEVRVDAPTEPLTVEGDAYRLEQVLLNLLTNASRHASGDEGVDIRLRRDGQDAVIEVQDYGPGIPAAALANIFSEFYQSGEASSAKSGLGLGLFIAREIVAAHYGSIDVRSVVGEGTTFEIRLPLPGEHDQSSGDS